MKLFPSEHFPALILAGIETRTTREILALKRLVVTGPEYRIYVVSLLQHA